MSVQKNLYTNACKHFEKNKYTHTKIFTLPDKQYINVFTNKENNTYV